MTKAHSGIAHAASRLRREGALGTASIREPFDSLLTAGEESSHRAHDLRCDCLQITFPHEPKWDAVAEFRVQAGQPGLDHGRVFSFGEHPDELEGEPQTLFRITRELASLHPPIDREHIPDTAGVGGEHAANNADDLLYDHRHRRFVPASNSPDLIDHFPFVPQT